MPAHDQMDHTPHRPLWFCRADGQPWPCGEARLRLLAEHAERPLDTVIYLVGLLHEAMRDLYRLRPDDINNPSPGGLFDRFVGWLPVTRRSGLPVNRRSGVPADGAVPAGKSES